MNTTVSTSDMQSSYTVVASRDSEMTPFNGISIVLLSRGGRPFRNEQIQKLASLNLSEIISIESSGSDMDQLSHSIPELKCIIISETMVEMHLLNF